MPQNENTNAAEGAASFEEILQFDPFEGGEENNTAPPQEAAPGSETPSATPPGEENVEEQPPVESQQPQTPQQAAQQQPPKPVSQADLESLIRQQTDVLATAMSRAQPQPQQAPPAPRFNLAVPDQLLSALRSEDNNEFKAGVGALINSLANHVWENFRQAIQSELMPMLPRMIDQQVNATREQDAVGRDFYGTYPQLQNPMFAPMIQTVGAAIAEEYARSGRSISWGPELRDAIAERIFAVLPQLRQQAQQGRQPARRSFSTGNGARPPQGRETPQDEMMSMIFGPTR